MRALVRLERQCRDVDVVSDSDDSDDDEDQVRSEFFLSEFQEEGEEEDVSAAPDTFDLLENIGIFSPRTKIIHRSIINHPMVGTLIGVLWVLVFAFNALELSPELSKSYGDKLLRPMFWFVALVGLLLSASVFKTAEFMRTKALKECVQRMQEEPVPQEVFWTKTERLRQLGKACECECQSSSVLQGLNLCKWLLIIFGSFWSSIKSDWRCALAGVVVFVFLSCVSDAYMFGQSLAEALSEAMVHRVIEAVRGAEPGHDWQGAIEQYQGLRERLERLWERARFIYVFYSLALALSAFLFTCWLFVNIHRPGPEVSTLVGCLFFLLYCLVHLGHMIWRLGSITRLCQSAAATDDSILNAALGKLASPSLQSPEDRGGCTAYVLFLMAAPTGVRIFLLIDHRLMVSAGIPMVTGFVSCVSYTLVRFEMAGDDYSVTPDRLVWAFVGFAVLAVYDIALRWVDAGLWSRLRRERTERTD